MHTGKPDRKLETDSNALKYVWKQERVWNRQENNYVVLLTMDKRLRTMAAWKGD